MLLLAGLLLGLLGCEENVVQPDADLYPYSLWGILNPTADTQFVRVFPIEPTLTPGAPAPLDARFTTADLESGETVLWRDSVSVDSSGTVAHVFYAPFRPAYDRTYRVEITRSDGAASWVEVATPGAVEATIEAPSLSASERVILRATLRGEQPRLLRTDFEVFFAYLTGYLGTPPGLTPVCHYVHLALDYGDRVRRAEDGWRVEIDFTEAANLARRWVLDEEDALESDPLLLFYGNELRAVVANAEWTPPGGVFDPNVLVQPGAMENVQNGFGFVGSGYRVRRTWSLDPAFVEATGFAEGTSCERGKESFVRVEAP